MANGDELGHGNDRALLNLLVNVCLFKLLSDGGIEWLHYRSEGRINEAVGTLQNVHKVPCYSETLTNNLSIVMLKSLIDNVVNLLEVLLKLAVSILFNLKQSLKYGECI